MENEKILLFFSYDRWSINIVSAIAIVTSVLILI